MAPRKTPLRAVKDDDVPPEPPKPPSTLCGAADGSERDLLVMMRTKISATLDAGVPAHAQAPLYRQLRDIDKEIRLLDAKAKQADEDVAGATGDKPWDSSAI